MEKVIFLDVDGVLNCISSKSNCHGFVGVDKDKVRRLSKIVQETGAYIVLSSDWKYGWEKDKNKCEPHGKYLNNHLWKKGHVRIKDKTPDSAPCDYYDERGWEIKEWLNKHPEVEAWVVLDDVDFLDFHKYPEVTNHLVLTDEWEGLTDQDVEKAIEILTVRGD